MIRLLTLLLATAFAVLAVPVAFAQAATGATSAAGLPNTGEVRRVNKDAKKITIAHGPLKEVGMPPMTMAFAVTDPALLDKVKAGDKVRFGLRQSGDDLVITGLEVTR